MIVCPRCSKENQDHYKFCLGCGSELPRDAQPAPRNFTAPTPPAGIPAVDPALVGPSAPVQSGFAGAPAAVSPAPIDSIDLGATGPIPAGGMPKFGGGFGGHSPGPGFAQTAAAGPARDLAPAPVAHPASAPSSGPVPGPIATPPPAGPATCPRCGAVNPSTFKFCGGCGFNLHDERTDLVEPAAPLRTEAPPAVAARGNLVLIRPDGTEGDSFPLRDGETLVGRNAGEPFAGDSYLSPQHATFEFEGDTLRVRDEGSLNGVYYRIERDVPVPLEPGGMFRIGQEIIRVDTIEAIPAPEGVERIGSPDHGAVGRVSLVIGRETTSNAYCIPADGLHLGRERGDVVFPEDGYVSGLHCRLHGEDGQVYLTDVGSSNGTFVRVNQEHTVRSGALVLMGQQLFRVEY